MLTSSSDLMTYCKDIVTKQVVQEEFIALDGQFDLGYCKQILDDRTMTKAKLNTLVQKTFGQVVFFNLEAKNEITESLFNKHYRFGKYKNVRQWISFFYVRYGKLLTRESLFKYIVKQG